MAAFGVNLAKHTQVDNDRLHSTGVVYLGGDEWELPDGYTMAARNNAIFIMAPGGREFEVWTKELDDQIQTNQELDAAAWALFDGTP